MVDDRKCKGQTVYQIRVQGIVGRRWSEWFGGLEIVPQVNGETVMRGPIVDQAALHGILVKIRDMNLPLLSIEQVKGGA